MTYVWEAERGIRNIGVATVWDETLHLKKAWVSHEGRIDRNYKVTLAWIAKHGKRKWVLEFVDAIEPKTFSTLKAAKAYAVATVILGA